MINKLLRTDAGFSSLVLRVLLAIVFFPHGAQKVLGWFGGAGLQDQLAGFGKMGIPVAFGLLAIAAEFLGPLALVAGFLTRVVAFGIAVEMVVAVRMLHFANGFFMNWGGRQNGEGFEFHILVIAICVALMIEGGGLWSLDGSLSKKKPKKNKK